ncbi:lipopolysaccharide-induced tumor necrosis factor-alpha factor homolog [Episyrphus balteatus]|uniref:lipopolysaccharide-induced tumor necrosis factor-alpha factor homolog n=1 Tax=Episyrphus balteatus TaxID=286459 RepID=UPI0024867FC1|nr:lipopolysaccharide-induced tumor necrosis factor-alpha factor homolog [Episyrphus balteatus]
MEKRNMYPEMPELPGVPDAPPTYSQSYPSAPVGDVQPVMMSSGAVGPIPMQPQAVVYQTLPPIPPLGPRPCLVTCPSCHQEQMSTVRMEAATKTHLLAAVLCLVGCFCCVCVPYCVDSCKNANHYCSKCDAYLGVYNK